MKGRGSDLLKFNKKYLMMYSRGSVTGKSGRCSRIMRAKDILQ